MIVVLDADFANIPYEDCDLNVSAVINVSCS